METIYLGIIAAELGLIVLLLVAVAALEIYNGIQMRNANANLGAKLIGAMPGGVPGMPGEMPGITPAVPGDKSNAVGQYL